MSGGAALQGRRLCTQSDLRFPTTGHLMLMTLASHCRYEELCRVDEEEEDLEEAPSCNVERCQVRVTPSRPRLRIREDVREQHCRTLRQALHVWMDQFPEDFDDPPNYTSLTQLEAFCRRVLPNSELDIKVHRKASQIRRPTEPPPHKLGYPTGTSKPPPLVLKSAHLVHGLNNNSVYSAKDPRPGAPFFEDLNVSTTSPANGSSALDHGASDLQYADFLDIPETLFALQLTRMDCVRPFFGHFQ